MRFDAFGPAFKIYDEADSGQYFVIVRAVGVGSQTCLALVQN